MRSFLTFFFTLYLLNQSLCSPEISISVSDSSFSSNKGVIIQGETSFLGKSLNYDYMTGFIIESSPATLAGFKTAYAVPSNSFSSNGVIDLNDLMVNPAMTITAETSDSLLDLSVAAGFLNNDPYTDYIIGDPSYDSNTGRVYVIYGGPTSSITVDLTQASSYSGFSITGEKPNDFFGYSVSFVGDINGDTHNDFLIGAPFMNGNQGAVYAIFSGLSSGDFNLATASLSSANMGIKITGEAALSYFGYSVGAAGNFNKDSFSPLPDIIIGAYGLNSNQGAAYVIYGNPYLQDMNLATAPLLASKGLKITGANPGDNFGWSVSFAGDVDRDLHDDIIIGAPRANSGSGAAYTTLCTFRGPSGIFLLKPDTRHISTKDARQLVVFLKGKKFWTGNTMGIIYGSISLPATMSASDLSSSGHGIKISSSNSPDFSGSLFGFSVAMAGDLNGDNYFDVIVGAPGQNNFQGAAYVVYGSSQRTDLAVNLLTYQQGFQISTADQGGQLGYSVSTVRTFHGFGQFDSVIVSAPYTSGSGTGYIVFGSKLCSSKCDVCVSGTCQICKAGYAMLTSGCDVCPAETYLSGSDCKPCSNGCSYCQSDTICTTCSSTYYLYQQQCYQNCPPGTYTDGINCSVCPEDCPSSCTSDGLCPPAIPVTEYTSPITESQIKQANVSAAVFDGASLIGNSLCIGSSLPTNFGLVAKIIRNIRYLNVTVSPELQATFYVWKTQSKFLSAPSSWNQKFDHKSLPLVFERYGLSSVFLVNYWRSLIMTLIGFALFIIFKLLESTSYRQTQNQTTLHTISKTVNIAASNFALSQIYGSLDDIFFFFILEVQTIIFESGLNSLSFALGIILLIFAIAVLGAHTVTLIKYQKLKSRESPAEIQNYFTKYLNTYPNIKMIYVDFKDSNFLQQNFLLVHVIRCIISNIITTALYEYPLLQTLLLISTSIGMVIYLTLKKPFKGLIKACGQYFCEIILLFVHLFMLIMAIMNEAESQNVSAFKVLSKLIIVFNLILLLGSVVFMIVELFSTFYILYKEKTAAPSKTPATLPTTRHARKIEENVMRPLPNIQPIQTHVQQEEDYSTNISSYPLKQNTIDYQHLDSSQNQSYLNETIIPPPQHQQDQPYFEENSTQFYPSPEKNILESGLHNSGFSDFQPNFLLESSSHSPNISYSQAIPNMDYNNNPLNKRYNKRIVRQGTQQRSPQINFDPEIKIQPNLQGLVQGASSFHQKSSITSQPPARMGNSQGVKASVKNENIIKRLENINPGEKRNDVFFEEEEEPKWQPETKINHRRDQKQVEEKPKGAYDEFLQRMRDDLGDYGNQKERDEDSKEKKRVIAFWNK